MTPVGKVANELLKGKAIKEENVIADHLAKEAVSNNEAPKATDTISRQLQDILLNDFLHKPKFRWIN